VKRTDVTPLLVLTWGAVALAACGTRRGPPVAPIPSVASPAVATAPPASGSAAEALPAEDGSVIEGTVSAFVRTNPPACMPRSPIGGATVTVHCPDRGDATTTSGADGKIELRSAGTLPAGCTLTIAHPDYTPRARPLVFQLSALCTQPSVSGCRRFDVSRNAWLGSDPPGEVESSHTDCRTACPWDEPAQGSPCGMRSLRCTYWDASRTCPASARCDAGQWKVTRSSMNGNYACPNQAACPPAPPRQADTGPRETTYCHWVDTPATGCTAHAMSTLGKWTVSTAGCPVPPTASCPRAAPAAGAPCSGAGLVCEYGRGASWLDGLIAVCEVAGVWSVGRGADVDLSVDRGGWLSLDHNVGAARTPASPCTAQRPRLGAACTGTMECAYFEYWSERCEAGRWTSHATPPPGPPPGRPR
jgi:hypothetical protein